MAQPKCRRKSLSLGRRILCDYLHFSGGGHTAAAERLMRLADVAEARRRASPRPSWGAIMTKAFALAATAAGHETASASGFHSISARWRTRAPGSGPVPMARTAAQCTNQLSPGSRK